jgi:hypothetical protein
MSATVSTNTRTLGSLIGEARTILQDKLPTNGGALRYTDDEMFEAINSMLTEVRTKRPDLFLPRGLRSPVPYYSSAFDMNTAFPLDTSCYSAFVYYLVGRAELREDTFSDDSRAVSMMNKALNQLLSVQS